MSEFIKENYHTHTWRCQHANGTEREYVEAAIKNGIQVLGFADHVPCPFADGFVSRIRMTMEQTQDYVETLRALREEYREQIRILIGFEAEYIPEFYEAQMELVKKYECDYMILGQHFLGPENHSPYMGERTEDVRLLDTYVDMVLQGAETGSYKYVAHPDLIYFVGESDVYEAAMRRLCEGLKQLKVPVELNVLGRSTRRHYPTERFWKIAAEVGNDVIVGMDAHSVDHLTDVVNYERVMEFADKLGLKIGI